MKTRHIAYFRVSTDRQGQSGLGLEAQEAAVRDYLSRCNGQLIASFTEVESGKVRDRPQLAAALHACRRQKARLVIAKLDRLSRNLAFLAQLMEDGVDFVACDNPHATRTLLGMLAVFAEHEAREIGKRTKEALAAAKARGVKLGGFRGYIPDPQVHKDRAVKNAEKVRVHIDDIRRRGITSQKGIAKELNRLEVPTPRAGIWHDVQVKRLLAILDSNTQPIANHPH